ncbi:hypothetical protein GCM10011497_37710 [Elstera cyanobacteriorum]|nr:hypothetical protein GCM10011497_37710 [Elstera cyanobacteriorum]
MGSQILWVRWRTVACQILRGCNHDPAGGSDTPGNQATLARLPNPNREINAFLNKISEPISHV